MLTPPPYFTFESPNQFLGAIRMACETVEADAVSELLERGLPPVGGIHSLSVLTGYSRRFLADMAIRSPRYYRTFRIRKGRGFREIASPRVSLKVLQKWFGFQLATVMLPSDHVHGFVPGRSHLTAAKVHLNANWLVSVDLHDFFGSVSKARVDESLSDLGYSDPARRILVPLLTFRERLPQGSPASPALANLAATDLDLTLREVQNRWGVRMTRYADDITLSGTIEFPGLDLLADLRRAVTNAGWQLNEEKTEVVTSQDSARVLGLLVHGGELRLPKHIRNKVRALRHRVETLGHTSLNRRQRGLLSYAESVRRTNDLL